MRFDGIKTVSGKGPDGCVSLMTRVYAGQVSDCGLGWVCHAGIVMLLGAWFGALGLLTLMSSSTNDTMRVTVLPSFRWMIG